MLLEAKGEPVGLAVPLPDGQTVLYRGDHITHFSLTRDRSPHSYISNADRSQRTAFQFSSYGRPVVYSSSESGRFEIYLRSFPDPTSKLQASTNAGTEPRWSATGGRSST